MRNRCLTIRFYIVFLFPGNEWKGHCMRVVHLSASWKDLFPENRPTHMESSHATIKCSLEATGFGTQ